MAISFKQIGLTAAVAFGVAMAAAAPAKAAFVTTQEAGMDQVYSQSSFGNSPIDIRFGAQQIVAAPDLLDISSNAEINLVFNLRNGLGTPNNVVNFYYVDTISACGSTVSAGIVGCGEVNGNDFVVESSFAAGSQGAELLAHELGHNLGLPHREDAGALMAATLNNGTDLNAAEVAIIRNAFVVQEDQDGFFIDVQPVLIVAAIDAVPLPATAFMLIGGLAVLAAAGKRRRASA